MKIIKFILLMFFSISTFCFAESLKNYVNTCQQELGFTNIPNMKCSDGVLFAPPDNQANDPQSSDLTNDYLGYKRLGENLDLTFACRWLAANGAATAFSIELMIHNRQSGKTCFFQADDNASDGSKTTVSSNIVSPTVAANAASGTTEAKYWKSPALVDSQLRCVNCHTVGPYIASARIAPYLTQYGLLNNGHDNFATRYHAVGSTFNQWDSIASGNNVIPNCSKACHSIGSNSTATSETAFGRVLIPSLTATIADIATAGVMPPNANKQTLNEYRWVNMDTPTNDDGEYETLVGLEQQYPNLYCSSPSVLEAHVVGSGTAATGKDASFRHDYLSVFPDKLRYIDMRNGVKCYNSDQPLLADGSHRVCRDYEIAFQCSDLQWTSYYNKDRPDDGGKGDFEYASRIPNLCQNTTPIAMKVRAKLSSGVKVATAVPNDRLSQLDNKNLICLNSQQGSGNSCSNYVVRFGCSSITPPASAVPLSNHQNANNIGSSRVTFVVTENISGWTTWNMNGRQIYVNGILVSPNQMPLPPKTMDGKYYFTFASGGSASAGWTFW